MNADLAALAEAHGVSTWYEGSGRVRVDIAPEAVTAVLAQLGVAAGTPEAVRESLAAVRVAAEPAALPGTLVLREGQTRALDRPAELVLEDGTRRDLPDGLPGDLPLGWHSLHLDGSETTVVVAPRALPRPPRAWGWMLQLYALRSEDSWGIGDLADLTEFTTLAGEQGADVVLLNPLHAMTPSHPVEASPYSPSSRRFANPLYLRVEDTEEYRSAHPALRLEVDALRPPAGAGRIDYDAVWTAKAAALELLWRKAEPTAEPVDPALLDFATFCALAEEHGPRWRSWPVELRHPASPAVAAARVALADRVGFHVWLQKLCGQQLAAAQRAARQAGLRVGLVHDLAVGVANEGADSWALQDVLAAGVTVGAPPDAFNQQGQDWALPPWRPDRLVATGYAAYRDMLRAVLRHSDGIRIDHILGLWRLWWVPPGGSPREGAYVRYDADAMLGILALEAQRAGAVVIGEDLGTVLPEVTDSLAEHNVLGSAVLWFQRDPDAEGEPMLPAHRYPERATASVSTHDLPTAAGFLRGEHVRVRAELGLLDDLAAEQQRAARERQELLDLLRTGGFLPADDGQPEEVQVVHAMHAFLAATPSRFVLVSPYDVLREPRQPNLPGTVDVYPNWRIPLPVTVRELMGDPEVRRIIRTVKEGVRGQD
ncbi:4-alpha-glucanotransferase [Crossiella equi]|uniref:4-alpha-glucanotransferase n=1 Tax=Crossiella equi TaxID=130796 RepID=A0ABS5A9E3_9PSEU|nr:4-alpha-glucanotransferase [Crossiella equi]MBP2473203.1 4-alpha-glucanotransferase [Crossiella equi]